MALATETRTDTQIQDDVLAELKRQPRVSPGAIEVMVKDGIVTLTGTVGSHTARWQAADATRRIPNVKAVTNLIRTAKSHAARITVDVYRGKVTVADNITFAS